jgi:hypothetical protein
MRSALLVCLLACSCVKRYAAYEEASECPMSMTEEQRDSGRVRCIAMCSSYARDFYEFDEECKCRCMPASGYLPSQKRVQPKQPPMSQM